MSHNSPDVVVTSVGASRQSAALFAALGVLPGRARALLSSAPMRNQRNDEGPRAPLSLRTRAAALALIGAALATGGCRGEPGGAPASSSAAPASASAAAPPPGAVGIPVAPERVAKVMNPKGQPSYSGPTGTLKGHVRIKGDPPPDTGIAFPTGKCGEAAAAYGRLFRVGQDSALADALVTVVNYDGFVPEQDEAEKVTIHGCALSRRTVAASFGQRIEVANLDPLESYMPFLDGAPMRAVMVAVPKGAPVKLYAQEPGHYLIRDQLPKPFMVADVFVLKFSTHDVTDLDGEFEIRNIPVGKVLTSAFLPSINEDQKKEIEIKPGDNTLDFELSFDLGKWKEKKAKQPAPPASPSSSAAPAEPGPKG